MKSSLLFLVLLTLCFSFSQPLCNDSERALLLQFKDSFAIEEFASEDSSAYPKTDSWGRNGSECCVWDGVECDGESGQVIGLDLSNSLLYGSIDANSTLFGLTHLQTLKLAGSNFNYSQIPSSINRLSKLTLLDLSVSRFSGQIPYEILSLSRLFSLDLSRNFDLSPVKRLLQLKNPSLHSLTESLPRLKHLHLSYVDISDGVLPESLANFSSLEYLDMKFCKLTGEIPSSIIKLQHLRYLYLSWNNLSGQIPSLANLTQLEVLSLSSNGFESGNLSWLGSLTKISVFLAYDSNLIGPLPSSLGNLTRLAVLNLYGNKLSGPIPCSFASLVNLETIWLDRNNLSGEVDLGLFFGLKNLTSLSLRFNRLSVIIKPNINETIPQFSWLGLSSCNLIEFPKFLRHQKRLELLELDYNRMGGNIPKWLWNMSTQTLEILILEENFMTGNFPPILPFVNMRFLLVRQNSFTGTIPIPPPSILVYQVNGNNFSGEIPPQFCNVLDARETIFSGKSPQISATKNQLKLLDLSVNKLQGKLPRSLANCTMLTFLNLEDNKLDDVFPHCLGNPRVASSYFGIE